MEKKKNLYAWIVIGLVLFGAVSCSSKIAPITGGPEDEVIKQQVLEQIAEEVEKESTLTKEIILKPVKDGDVKYTKKDTMNYSLYIEYFKQENYPDAYKYWRRLFKDAPAFNIGLYVNGEKMIGNFIENAADDNIKSAWVDTLMTLYDQRIEYFDQKGFVLGKKGTDLFLNRFTDFEKAYTILSESITLEGDNSEPTTVYYYLYAASYMFKYKKIDTDKFLEIFENAMNISENNVKLEKNVDTWNEVVDNMLKIVGPLLPEDVLLPFADKKYDLIKDNAKKLKLYIDVMVINQYVNNDVFYKFVKRKLEISEPTSDEYYNLGIIDYNKGKYESAISNYKKAIELEESVDKQAKYYMNLAASYDKAGNNSSARSSALKAAELNPSDPTPYLFIGNLYSTSAITCGTSDFEKQSVYWIAVDMYKKAQARGSSEAAGIISQLEQAYPTKEEAFYQDPPVKEGQTINIGCWINGTTTARFIK